MVKKSTLEPVFEASTKGKTDTNVPAYPEWRGRPDSNRRPTA